MRLSSIDQELSTSKNKIFGAVQASCTRHKIDLADPVMWIVKSLSPILGSLVDLLKDGLFAAFVVLLAAWRRMADTVFVSALAFVNLSK